MLDKISCKEAISLVENGAISSDDQLVADTLNNYFNNVDENLLILSNKSLPKKKTNGFNLDFLDPVEAPISKCKNHQTLNSIKGKILKLGNPNFDFEYTSLDQTSKELEKVAPLKASQVNIPVGNQRK